MNILPFDTIVRGGMIVTASDVFEADIGIRAGRIAALGDDLGAAAEIIDAKGLLVMPGGIDSHVHLEQDQAPGIVAADGFLTGTRSAVMGGNTTVLPFCLQKKGKSLRAALDAYRARAEGQCYADIALHLIVSDPTPQVLGQELPALIAEGYTSIKVYMTYDDLRLDDRQMLDVLALAARAQATVMVHAENHDAIRYLSEKLEREGRNAPPDHARARPIPVEREATHRAITLAEIVETPILIVHVSNRQSMEEIRRARQRGLKIYSETCPQYLVLTEDELDREGTEGNKFICSPPPRDRESQEACWEGIEQGVFDVVSSDHCPYRYDATGKLTPGGLGNFRNVPNGIPGIATRMPILFSEGVVKGRIDLNRFVALTSTNHAKRYGLYPRKGTIAVGSDADLVLWDPKRQVTITHDLLKDGCDYTPYEGMRVTGWPVATILRGKTVMADGELRGEAGQGQEVLRQA